MKGGGLRLTLLPNAISMNFYICGSSHMIKEKKSTVVSIQGVIVSWFLKIIQVTLKHDPFHAM
jgi:hypothetical protein